MTVGHGNDGGPRQSRWTTAITLDHGNYGGPGGRGRSDL